MPFLAPLAAPLIGSAVSAVGGGLLGKATGGPSNYQKQGFNLLNQGAQTGLDASTQARNTGMGFLNRFSNTINAPTSYFQSLLSGNRAASTAALAPDIARIGGGLNEATQAASTLAPRGAGRSSVLFNLPFQAQAQTSGLFNTLRPQAAAGLTGIAGMEGTLGANLMNAGANYLSAGTGAARGTAEQGNIFQQQQAKAGAGFTTALANLPWNKVDYPDWMGGGFFGAGAVT